MRPTKRVQERLKGLYGACHQAEFTREKNYLFLRENRREYFEDEFVGQAEHNTEIDVTQSPIVVAVKEDLTLFIHAERHRDRVPTYGQRF